MLLTKPQGHHVTQMQRISFCLLCPLRIHMKFGFDWPSGFWREDVWRVFPICVCKTSDPWDRAIFGPRAIIWTILVEVHKIKLNTYEKWKINFQDGRHGGQLGFPIGRILAVFELQVTSMLPIKFWVKWPRGGRRSRLLKQTVDTPRGTLDRQWTFTNHKGSPWALLAHVSSKDHNSAKNFVDYY